MSLAAFLSELTTSSGIDQAVGSDFVEQYIQSIEDLQQLNAFARAHTLLGKCLYSAASWELFDKVYALSLGGGQEISRKILSDTVTLLSEQVRPKELVLMTTEKLAGCSDTNSFAVLLFAMQLVIAGSNSAGSWEQGLASVLRKTAYLCSLGMSAPHTSDEEAEEQQQSTRFGSAGVVTVHSALDFATQLTSWLESNTSVDGSELSKMTNLTVGFLLNLNARVFLPLTDAQLRRQYVATTTRLILRISGGQVEDIFQLIHRAKFVIFCHEYDIVKRAYLQKYCNRHTETCKEADSATPLTTEDANSLLNRIAQSEYSNTLLRYYDTTLAAMYNNDSEDSASASASAKSACSSWCDAVCWDHVTDERLAEIITFARTSAAEDSGAKSGTMSSQRQSMVDDCFVGAPELAWSITGIALLAHAVLSRTQDNGFAAADGQLPVVYNRAYLLHLVRPYALVLLRSTAANPEGLQLMNMLHSTTSAHPPNAASGQLDVPIFMSFLSQQTVPTVLSHITLSFYNSLSAFRSFEGAATAERKVFWSADDATKLGYLSARANDILATTQTFITSMAGCADSELRTSCFASFRTYLKQIEERSLFGLLLTLVEHCPYPNMAGLLIDLTKECVQAASNGHSWSAFPAAAAVVVTCTAAPWLLEFQHTTPPASSISTDNSTAEHRKVAGKAFPMKKLLSVKTVDSSSAASDADGVRNTAMDVDNMTVVESKRHVDPATGGTSVHIDEDAYLDVRAGTTKIDAAKLVEVREAAPFIWAGRSPFWSPLVLQRCLLEPLRELLDHASAEKILECMDIIAARVNLAQYVVLKLLTDTSISAGITTTAQAPTTASPPVVVSVLDEYFSGAALNATSVTTTGAFPYAFSKLRAAKDVYALYFALKKLRKVVKSANKGTASAMANPLDTVRTQLLETNLEHLIEKLHTLCNALYLQLQVVA